MYTQIQSTLNSIKSIYIYIYIYILNAQDRQFDRGTSAAHL